MIDIYEMLRFSEEMRIKNSSNLTVGEMLKELKDMPEDAEIKIDLGFVKEFREYITNLFDDEPEYAEERAKEFENCNFYFSNYFYSYRGYYCDMAIEISKNKSQFKVKDMICLLNKAKEEAIMEGYKGGEFSINDNTLLWLETAPNESNGIAPIKFYKLNDNEVLLLTKHIK